MSPVHNRASSPPRGWTAVSQPRESIPLGPPLLEPAAPEVLQYATAARQRMSSVMRSSSYRRASPARSTAFTMRLRISTGMRPCEVEQTIEKGRVLPVQDSLSWRTSRQLAGHPQDPRSGYSDRQPLPLPFDYGYCRATGERRMEDDDAAACTSLDHRHPGRPRRDAQAAEMDDLELPQPRARNRETALERAIS